MFFVPEKSSSIVCKAERDCRSIRAFGIHKPRSHREEAYRIRDDLDGVVGGELIVVFLHKCEERGVEKRRGPGRGGRAMQSPGEGRDAREASFQYEAE